MRIEYEDDFRFWFYDSAKPANYAKVLRTDGGNGSGSVDIILQDGAGFLRATGSITSSGAYDLDFSFADRPSYNAALAYDQQNAYGENSPLRRAATWSDLAACAKSSGGLAKFTDGSDCAQRFVLHYSFFTDLNVVKPEANITDTHLWLLNQATVARELVTNQFPTKFAQYGVNRGNFGRLLVNGL